MIRTASLLLLLSVTTHAAPADWPEWRGPLRNGVLPAGPHLLESVPPAGLKVLWESEPIPSKDDGGLSSPVVAEGKVYLSVAWQTDEPSATRQIDERVLRQLGHVSVQALSPEILARMEETRLNLSPALRGKKLDEFAASWVEQNLDPKLQPSYAAFVAARFRKGKSALPLEVLQTLEKHQQTIFTSEAEMNAWLAEQGWSEEMRAQIAAVVPPTRRIAEDVLVCLDLASGRTLWKSKAPGEPTGFSSSSTPCVAEGKVFSLGSKQAYAIEAATGRILWSAPLAQKGCAASPLYSGGTVIVNARGLCALDAGTGKERWSQPKAGGGNSSPVAWKGNGRTLILCNGRSALQAVDAETGAIVWSAPGGGDSTPAVQGDRLVVQTRSSDVGLVAYRLFDDRAEKLWNIPMEPRRNQSSPIVYGDLVFLFDNDRSLCCSLDSGRTCWQEPLPGSISSPILADGKLFTLVGNGNALAIVKPEPSGRLELGRGIVKGAWCPSPAIADGRLLIRQKDSLKCFDLAAAQP